MKVILEHSTPLWVASKAIRTCWECRDKPGIVWRCQAMEE